MTSGRSKWVANSQLALLTVLTLLSVWGIVKALATATQPSAPRLQYAMLLRRSYYEFCSDGKPLFWFTSVADGALRGVVFREDSVAGTPNLVSAFYEKKDSQAKGRWVVTSPHFASNHSAVRISLSRLPDIEDLLKEKDAIAYFLQTHHPLDEGYQYISDYSNRLDSTISPIIRLKHAICSPGRKTVVEKIVFLMRSGERGVRSENTFVNEVDKQSISHSSLPTPHSSFIGPRDSIGRPHGTGFTIERQASGEYKLSFGEWRHGRFLGERLYYTSDRVYGIDISRWQHDYGGQHMPIDWANLRITNIGQRSRLIAGEVDLPVSFVYIKATEATTIVNRHYATDYQDAHTFGYHTGTYHFFSLATDGEEQAVHFLRHMRYLPGDLPPVLDIEPTDQQIVAAGGEQKMFQSAKRWLEYVKDALGVTPIIYANQHFVKRYLSRHPELRDNYPVWIARYSEYIPDFKLLYWQLSPEGRVRGITGYVDINVFNGYQAEFDKFTTDN